MPALNIIALILTIIGGINWGLVGLADINLVSALFGSQTFMTRLVYMLVGLSALYCLMLIPRVTAADDRIVPLGR